MSKDDFFKECKIIDIFWQLQVLPHGFFERILIKCGSPPNNIVLVFQVTLPISCGKNWSDTAFMTF